MTGLIASTVIAPGNCRGSEPENILDATLELPSWDYNLTISPDEVIKVCNDALSSAEKLSTKKAAATYKRRAEAFIANAKYKEALEDLDKVLTIGASDRDARCKRAAVLSSLGKNEEATSALKEIIKEHPQYAPPLVELAAISAQGRDNELAIKYLTTAIELDKQFLQAYFMRAQVYYRQSDYQRCIHDLDFLIERLPLAGRENAERPYLIRGNAFSKLGEHERAVANLHMAARLAPNSVEIKYALWSAYYSSQRYNVSLKIANEIVSMDQKHGSGYYACASTLNALQKPDEALAVAKRGLLVTPDNVHLLYEVGHAYDNLGRYDSAIDQYNEVLAREADHPRALFKKASLLCTCPDEKIRDGKAALEIALRGERITRKDKINRPLALEVLAAAYAENGQYEEAVKTVQNCIKLSNDENQIFKDLLSAQLDLYKAGKPYRRQ